MTILRTCDHCCRNNDVQVIKEGGELRENVIVRDVVFELPKNESMTTQLCDDCRNNLIDYIKAYINVEVLK